MVQIGETPFSISRKNNISIKDLAALNGLDMAHPTVKIGQTLVLKPQSAPPVFPPAKTDSSDTVSPSVRRSSSLTPATNLFASRAFGSNGC